MEKIILLFIGIILLTSCCKDRPYKNPCETKTAILPPDGYELNTIAEIDFHGSIRSFQFINQKVGYILASNQSGGHVDILKTTDGGKNWVDLNIIHTQHPRNMIFKDEQFGIITVHNTEGCPPPNCQHKCVILKTEDGGITWKEKEFEDMKGIFYHPKYDNHGNLYAYLGFFNLNVTPPETQTTLMKSKDNGETWDTLFSSSELDVSLTTNILEIINDKIFVSTIDNKMLVIDTAGTLIKTLEIGIGGIYDVELFDMNNLILVSSAEAIKSTDGGETWQTIHQGRSRMIGFNSTNKGLLFLTKSVCSDFDVGYTDDFIAATNSGGIEWKQAKEGATNLMNKFSGSQKMNESSWNVIIDKKLLEIKEN